MESETFGIGRAVDEMTAGKKVRRESWNGRGMWVAKQVPDQNSKMTEPYAFLRNAQGGLIPWACSQADLFATDWTFAQD